MSDHDQPAQPHLARYMKRFTCWTAQLGDTVEAHASSVRFAAERYAEDVEQDLDVLVCDEDGRWWEVVVVSETRYFVDSATLTDKRPVVEQPADDEEA